MSFTDNGLEKLGSFLAGEDPTPPNNVAFGTGSSGFIGSESYLNNEFYRKSLTWGFYNGRPRGQIILTSTDANGSNIQEFGLGTGSTGVAGSNLYTRNSTAIGVKNNTFDVEISFTPVIRRG